MSDGYAESANSDDAPATPRNKKSPSSKQRRAGQTASTPSSGAKRLKKASDQASYAITETKSPASSGHPGKGKSAGQSRGTFLGSPSPPSRANSASSPRLSPPVSVSSPPPLARASTPLPEGVLETGRHTHHGLRWLYNDRRDKERRTTDDDNYNPRTLYVPPSFIKAQTPAMQQWWLFKSENMDTVLFFKVRSPCSSNSQFCGFVFGLSLTESACDSCISPTRYLTQPILTISPRQVGKFYELFHQDADVGMQELDLIYMKGEKAHSGFPEISYGKFADSLVS